MKKPYTKPTMAFQNMFLATGVSGGCTFISNHAYDSCKTLLDEWGDETIYALDKGCSWSYVNYPCYDVPTESSNIFDS